MAARESGHRPPNEIFDDVCAAVGVVLYEFRNEPESPQSAVAFERLKTLVNEAKAVPIGAAVDAPISLHVAKALVGFLLCFKDNN